MAAETKEEAKIRRMKQAEKRRLAAKRAETNAALRKKAQESKEKVPKSGTESPESSGVDKSVSKIVSQKLTKAEKRALAARRAADDHEKRMAEKERKTNLQSTPNGEGTTEPTCANDEQKPKNYHPPSDEVNQKKHISEEGSQEPNVNQQNGQKFGSDDSTEPRNGDIFQSASNLERGQVENMIMETEKAGNSSCMFVVSGFILVSAVCGAWLGYMHWEQNPSAWSELRQIMPQLN